MELELGIVMMVGLGFIGILAYKSFKHWNSAEAIKNETNAVYQSQIQLLKDERNHLVNSNKAYMYKIRKIRESYEIDYDDIEDDVDADEFKLSDLATSIYPKLPPSLAKLIDKEEFVDAIARTVEKKPDIIGKFADIFLGKDKDRSTSNTTPALKEVYN